MPKTKCQKQNTKHILLFFWFFTNFYSDFVLFVIHDVLLFTFINTFINNSFTSMLFGHVLGNGIITWPVA